MENKWKNKNFIEALKNSSTGMKYAFQTERNLKIQLVFAMIAIILAIVLKLTPMEWMILMVVIGSVLFAEMVNTAIEIMLDAYTQEPNKNIKLVKDVASGAVLLTSIVSVVIGIILFLPKIGK